MSYQEPASIKIYSKAQLAALAKIADDLIVSDDEVTIYEADDDGDLRVQGPERDYYIKPNGEVA